MRITDNVAENMKSLRVTRDTFASHSDVARQQRTPEYLLARRIVNRIASVILFAAGPSDAFERASCNQECADCGDAYWRHCQDPYRTWLTVLCDGTRVKL